MKRTWTVQTSRGQWQKVAAEHCDVRAACIVFYRFAGKQKVVELAFAPGQWLTVHEDQQ